MQEIIDRLIALQSEYNLTKSRRNSAWNEYKYYEDRVLLLSEDIRNVNDQLSTLIMGKAKTYD